VPGHQARPHREGPGHQGAGALKTEFSPVPAGRARWRPRDEKKRMQRPAHAEAEGLCPAPRKVTAMGAAGPRHGLWLAGKTGNGPAMAAGPTQCQPLVRQRWRAAAPTARPPWRCRFQPPCCCGPKPAPARQPGPACPAPARTAPGPSPRGDAAARGARSGAWSRGDRAQCLWAAASPAAGAAPGALTATGSLSSVLLCWPLASLNTRVKGMVVSFCSGSFRSSSITW